ncbi:MAG: GDP-L-fucose synthase [Thermodesulfobacteriota bacterium]|nr:GDP-L-fucose synthase [Thermodesulfobacteriota bacterium]
MEKNSSIYVAGYYGMVGSSIVRKLKDEGYVNVFGYPSPQLDLMCDKAVENMFKDRRPEYVFLAAAKVGGIYANIHYPAEFIFNNLKIQTNVIQASYLYGVKKLLFLGSSCIYPRLCPQPMKEARLLTGSLEETNQYYATAKIAGIKMCQAYNKQYGTHFISCMPTNLYGPNDNYDSFNSHVIPALIKRFHDAKTKNLQEVVVWGTGKIRREFLFVDDLAEACLFLMNRYNDNEIINVGTGYDITIQELASMIKEVVGYSGRLVFDHEKPDGPPRKLLDIRKIKKLGWIHKTSLKEGLEITYSDFQKRLG